MYYNKIVLEITFVFIWYVKC